MSDSSNEYVALPGSLDAKKHFAVTPMDKSHVDICRSCPREVLFEICFRDECN